MPRRRAKTPRNTDTPAAEVDVEAVFRDLFPEIDLEAIRADPANKELTRQFDAAVTKKMLTEAAARAWGSRDGGEPVPYYLAQLPALVKLDAEIAGNLGERVVEVPSNRIEALLNLLGLTKDQGLQLAASLPQLAARREEKVVEDVRSRRKKAD